MMEKHRAERFRKIKGVMSKPCSCAVCSEERKIRKISVVVKKIRLKKMWTCECLANSICRNCIEA